MILVFINGFQRVHVIGVQLRNGLSEVSLDLLDQLQRSLVVHEVDRDSSLPESTSSNSRSR